MATHVAVTSGDWFDPATWGGAGVPGDGALVHIPAGIEVGYQGASDAGLFMVRVDGSLTLTAEAGAATKMVVDTIVTSESSRFAIDASAPDAGTVDVVFAEGTPAAFADHYTDTSAGDGVLGRSAWDPEQLSLGLVAGGEVAIEGQPTMGWFQLATGVGAGDSVLSFDLSDPSLANWQPGQKLVIGAADWQGRGADGHLASHEEVRSIAAVKVEGGQMIVTLDRPLDFDHRGPIDPTTGAELTTAVGNLSRNVTFSSAVADQDGDGMADRALSLGEPAGPLDHLVTERGHVMFMHTDDVSVGNAAFFGLGRTDKSRPVDDFVTDGSLQNHRLYQDNGTPGVYDPGIDTALETPPEQIENMRARYPLHFHRAGVGEGGAPDAPRAELHGNAIWGSPGWGIVQHDTTADLTDNVTFDVAGTAFVAETGNETGTWTHNAAFGTYGATDPADNDDSNDFNNDFGGEGVGFWLQGRAIALLDNAAVSSARAGFMYRVNGVDQIDVPTAALGPLAAIAPGAATIANADLPVRVFEGNLTIGAEEGLRIVTDPLDSVRKFNDAWSVMRDFTAWQVEESGVSVTYASKYVFDNFLLLGTGAGAAPGTPATAGFHLKASVADITVTNSHVEGFRQVFTDWVQVGDRQEYRRGFWDPKDPAAYDAVPAYQGLDPDRAAALGIDNAAHNLWNLNLVDVTHANISGQAKYRAPEIAIDTASGPRMQDPLAIFRTGDADPANDPDFAQPLVIGLVDDSAAGGLVALWREAPEARAGQIPLAYEDSVYLGQIHFADGGLAKRVDYLDPEPGINADIWSGTVLEFAKTDALGTRVFAYDDFAPLDPGGAVRAVSTNERILFTREMIDGVLENQGYYSFASAPDVKFVEMRTLFSDRLTGEMEDRRILVALDLAWEVPAGAVNNGAYAQGPDRLVAAEYVVFENGRPVPGRAPVVPDLADPATLHHVPLAAHHAAPEGVAPALAAPESAAAGPAVAAPAAPAALPPDHFDFAALDPVALGPGEDFLL